MVFYVTDRSAYSTLEESEKRKNYLVAKLTIRENLGYFKLKTQGTSEIIHREETRHECVVRIHLAQNILKAVKIFMF